MTTSPLCRSVGKAILAILLLSIILQVSALKIREVKPFPDKLILVPGQHEKFYTEDYFAGFNLTFNDASGSQKLSIIDSHPLDSSKDVISTKSFKQNDGLTIASLYSGNSVAIVKFAAEKFSEPFQMNLDQAKTCHDLEFLNQDTIVVDCNIESGKAFFFISVGKKSVLVTEVDETYTKHARRQLVASNGFMNTDLIVYISSDNTRDTKGKTAWQLNLFKFTNKYNIKGSATQISVKDILNLDPNFELYSLQPFGTNGLLLAGKNATYWVRRDEVHTNVLAKYPIDGVLTTLTPSYTTSTLFSALAGSDDAVYELLRSESEGFLDVPDIFVDTIYSIDDAIFGKTGKVKNVALTKDFAMITTGGDNPSVYIYNRGDPKNSDIFFFNSIDSNSSPTKPPAKLIAIPEENKVIWVTEDNIYALAIQEVWIHIINDRPGLHVNETIRICSSDNCIDKKIEINYLNVNDYSIQKVGPEELKLVKTWDDDLDIIFDDLFIGPRLQYYLVTDDGMVVTTPDQRVPLSMGNMTFTYMTIAYDAEHDNFRVYHQLPASKDLDLYICFLVNQDSHSILRCDNKGSAKDVGKVLKVHSKDPSNDIIEAIDSTTGRMAAYEVRKKFTTSKIDLNSEEDSCNVFYQSEDNTFEKNFFCARHNTIKVLGEFTGANGTIITLDPGFIITKILTHHAFPGLLFVSSDSSIVILYSELYIGELYSYDTDTVSTIHIDDPSFKFVVTSSHLIVFLPQHSRISVYDITNPGNISLNKQINTPTFTLVASEHTIAYSPSTDLVYFYVQDTNNPPNIWSIVVLDTSNDNYNSFKYLFIGGYTQNSAELTLSVTPYHPEYDFLLFGSQGFTTGLIIGQRARVTLTGNFIPSTEIFAEKSFKITAMSPSTQQVSQIDGLLLIVNTQRIISPLKGNNELFMDLAHQGSTKLEFKEGELFNGPAFRFKLQKEYDYDNIVFKPRVHPEGKIAPSLIPAKIADLSYKRGRIMSGSLLILEEGTSQVHVYNTATFPETTSKIDVVTPHGYLFDNDKIECHQVEVDPQNLYMAVLCYDLFDSASYIDIMLIKASNINFQLLAPTQDYHVVYKIVGDYLFYIVRDGYFAVYVYKVYQKENADILQADLVQIVTRDDLKLRTGDNITDLAVTRFGPNEVGAVLVTGATGFNYLYVKNDKVKISSPTKFVELFEDDHLTAYNSVPTFTGISLLSFYNRVPKGREKVESDTVSIYFLLTSAHEFAYRLNLTVNYAAEVKDVRVIEGYIQYQGYQWKELVYASADTVILVGESESSENPPKLLTNYFFYDRRSPSKIETNYPLYDAFQVITEESTHREPVVFLARQRAEECVYLRNTEKSGSDSTNGLVRYVIGDQFAIETPAARVTSSYVDLIAGNDLWNSTIRVSVRNYGNLFKDVSPGKIVLFVFGATGIIFIIFVILARVFSDKNKRQLRDTAFNAQPESNETQEETNTSQYFKLEE